jgi:hypothetical protein
MNITEAIEILEIYNKWRRDDSEMNLTLTPKQIGIAIDVVVNYFKTKKK